MKKRYQSLNMYYKVCLWSTISLIVVIGGTCCLFFLGYPDIPQGILLGALIGILSYLLLGIIDKKEMESHKSVGSIIITIVRFLLLAGAIVLSAWLSFEANYQIFNIFGVVGGYLLPLIWLIIFTGKENKIKP